jgi:hypothetical protein
VIIAEIKHLPEPIQAQIAGNTLASHWLPHCSCSWTDPNHLYRERGDALTLTLEHIAATPEMWPPPAAA